MEIDEKIKRILEILRKRSWTMGVVESCTGGAMADAITNIPGASDVFDEGKVTYSVESKIRAGVRKEIIEEFGVYSAETAGEMAGVSRGQVGVGITGNLPGEVWVAVRIENKIESIKVSFANDPAHKAAESQRATEHLDMGDKIKARKKMKKVVVEKVVEMIYHSL